MGYPTTYETTSDFIRNIVNGFSVFYTEPEFPNSSNIYIVTPAIPGNWLNDKKFIVGVETKDNFVSSGSCNLLLQGAITDDPNPLYWLKILELKQGIQSTGLEYLLADLSNYSLPYYRFAVNYSDSPAILSTEGSIKLIFGC